MKKALLIIATVIAVSGCAKQAETTEVKGAGGFEVSRLFRHDGCTIYRFSDAGRYQYFSKCDTSSEVFWSELHNCGKNCTRIEKYSVPTNQGRALVQKESNNEGESNV